ncbi:endonuclease/exonuclease/phosphatase family protein, partial [Trifolium medium]|nr:endonuclease/exonuclease/phosphatase family protein [Trifolium medium]
CDLTAKRQLWQTLLMSKGGFGGGAWCVLGDFNAVLHSDERRGLNQHNPSSPPAEIAEFRDFVVNMDLTDIPVLGRKFTWFHSNGITMSRIDRVLVSDDWLSLGDN